MTTPSVNVSTSAQASSVSTIAATLSAVPAGDIILVYVNAESNSTAWNVSSVTASGLTFTSRAQITGSNFGQASELWWAPCPSGFTGVITATLSMTIDDATMHAFSVTGANTSNPFDAVSATTAQSGGSSLPLQTSFSTTAAQALVVACGAQANSSTLPSSPAPAGMTTVSTQANSGAVRHETSAVEAVQITSAMSATTVGWGTSYTVWTLLVDAIVAPGTGPAAALTAARTARGIAVAAAAALSAALTAARTSRSFALAAVVKLNAALTAARAARGFTLTAHANVTTAAGRPDADTPNGWGRLDREFLLIADTEPPIDPPPATHAPTLYRRASYSYTPPTTAADGWSDPTQTRTLINGSIVGRHRFRFDGVDHSFYRSVPMRLLEDGHANPFGPTIAVIHCPQISPFEAKPAWLHDGARVVIDLLDDHDVYVPGSAIRGFCHNFTPELAEDNWGLTVEVKGFLYQGDDAQNKPLPVNRGSDLVPTGYRLADLFNHVETRYYAALARVDTSPAKTRQRGSLTQKVTDFARALLAESWTADGRQWTVLDVPGVTHAQIVLPDPTTVDYSLSVGQDGVTFDLHEELDELPNVVYGEWIDPDGGRHQRLKFPRLHEDKSPTYPLTVGAVFNPGSGTAGFQPFSDWMRRNGFSGFDSQDTYLASDSDDVKAAQKRMGVTDDGVVGAQTWGTAFNTGADVGSLFAGIYLPIGYDTRVMKYLYAPDGSLLGRNPAFDPTIRRKEVYINFGEGLTYKDVRRSAEQIVARSTGLSLVGQITVKGTDFEEASTLVARSGTTLRLRYLYGTGSTGVSFHLAQIHRTYDDDGTVTATLDVDTKWRDAYTVAQIIERNKAARDDPARAIRHRQTSGLSQDTKIQFDADDIGRIYRHNVQGGFWRIVEFPAASWGTWVRLTVVTSPATEFALMLFSKEITARDLDRLVGNPLSVSRPYNPQATALEAAGLIQAWGSFDQPAGYSQTNAADGYKSDGDTLTGRLEYDSSVEFAPANGASLFLAEWCAASTVIHETFDLQPVSL